MPCIRAEATETNTTLEPTRRAVLGRAVTLIACGLTSATTGAQPAVFTQDLEGVWLVSVENQRRDRFLRLAGVRFRSGTITAETALYGWIDGKGKPIEDLDGLVEGARMRLRFTTPGHSRVEVDIDAGHPDQAVIGTMVTKGDRQLAVRLTKLSAREFDQMRSSASAERLLDRGIVKRNSAVQFLYVGAPDCPSCIGWEADYFGRKQLMAERLPEFPRIDFIQAKLASYRGGAGMAFVLPDNLKALARQGPQGQPAVLRCRGTPYFALLVDNQLLSQVHGTSAFETVLLPLIRRAVALKDRAA